LKKVSNNFKITILSHVRADIYAFTWGKSGHHERDPLLWGRCGGKPRVMQWEWYFVEIIVLYCFCKVYSARA